MAKLITKFKYLKPGARKQVGRYAKYIATRERVEKIDDSKRYAPNTKNQEQMIAKILADFPDSKNMLEYEDYIANKTIGTASEFISRAIEENADKAVTAKTYADYIATRPRAERFGSHGLFTDDGVYVKLNEVSDELNVHEGNVWTAIISLRRKDAQRLGYDNGTRWRDMLRTQTTAIAENFKIPLEHLRWYAAFHNESHHPHVHMIVYSTVPGEGYLTKQGVNKLRSAFANDIFQQDLMCIYEQQTEQRNELRAMSREEIAEIVAKINLGSYDNLKVEELLMKLAERLSKTSGKKVYGYLKPDVKAIVDSIVDELASDERIKELYDLWYKQKKAIGDIYNQQVPPRVPLSQNNEFKPIRNAVIQEALHLNVSPSDDEDEIEVVTPKYKPFVTGNQDTAAPAHDVAEDEVPENEKAEPTVHYPNPKRITKKRNTPTAIGVLRLFQHLSNTIQNSIPGYPKPSSGRVDRKLQRKINEKKESQGLKIT